jgi:sodium/pantothenate symporter
MAKDEHVVIRSACGASIAMFLLYLINSYAAAAVNLSNPSIDPPESVMIWVAMNLMPTVLGALLVCGILAAGLSSASTFLSLIGFSSTNDIFKHDNHADRQLTSTRYTIIFVGVAVVLLCLILPSNIFWITYFAGPVFASSWGVVAFMSVWSKNITESGAFWGMLSGFFGNITANLIQVFGDIKLPVYLDPILVGSAISLFTVIMISSLGQVKPASEAFRKKLHQMPENINNKAEIARTLLWPKAMIVLGILVMVLMVNFYAIPYDRSVTKKTLMEFTP